VVLQPYPIDAGTMTTIIIKKGRERAEASSSPRAQDERKPGTARSGHYIRGFFAACWAKAAERSAGNRRGNPPLVTFVISAVCLLKPLVFMSRHVAVCSPLFPGISAHF
jgi:hypothetical protein